MARRPRHGAADWRSGSAEEVGHINVTPLIDVVMCLIIFFLLVGQLAFERRGAIDLPETDIGEKERAADRPIAVLIAGGGIVRVDGVEVGRSGLADAIAALRREEPGRAVQVRADRAVPFGEIRPVIAACRELGIGEVRLAARARTGAEVIPTAPTRGSAGDGS